MTTLFIVCAIVGGAVLALQIVLGLVGLEHEWELPFGGHELEAAGDAVNLFSVRALSAGVLFFGLVGLAFPGSWVALPAALAAGAAAAVAVALAMRAILRLESDGNATLYHAVGETGSVYLSIPGGRGGRGKVHVTLRGHTVECEAVSEHPLPTGASVLVIDVVAPDLVEVIPSPQLGALDA
ncbi:MAG TPA: hypothetical protein VHG91_19775 [Longimicrobium sp.]|nr:hypothetical protein [Longimicrobium sp.]